MGIAGAGASNTTNIAAGMNNVLPVNIGGTINTGSIGNANITQGGSSTATGGT